MKKLAAADAAYLYSETAKCTSNIASVNIMALPENTSSAEFITSLRRYLNERVHLVDYLTRKLFFVPGNMDHPVWVEDDTFDIDNHVIEFPAEAPGGRAEMEQAVAAIHEIKMPLERPLWAWHVITGLKGNQVAIYNQAHHAALDGASGNAAYVTLMDESPEHPQFTPPVASTNETRGDNSLTELFEQSFQNFMRFQLESASRMMGTAETAQRLINRALDPSKDFGAFGQTAPATPFNRQISEKRAWATAEMPLADIKQLGKKMDATINDMVMAICAGGLRTYLQRAGALPNEALIAGCPVSLRKPGDTTPGNQVSMMNVDLGTNIENPLDRIIAIHESATTAKAIVSDLASAIDNNMSIPGLPAVIGAQAAAAEALGLANHLPAAVNVVISNVPGPRNTLYANGAAMLTHYPVSIATHGLALNITVQSYRDQLFMGITACAEAVPDISVLRDDIMDAYLDLNQRLQTNVTKFKQRELAENNSQEASYPQNKVA